jgi:hypothetical protein
MYKALAVLRTIFLIFIVGYTVRATPLFTNVATTFDEQYARCTGALNLLIRAAWFAVAWIGFETLLGWVLLRSKPRPVPAPGSASGSGSASTPPRS